MYQAALAPPHQLTHNSLAQRLHLDMPLLIGLLILVGVGLGILYSAGDQSPDFLIRQGTRLSLAFAAMFIFAQIPPLKLRLWAPWIYGVGLFLLATVLLIGVVGKGAQRWLDLGLFRFQPSEIMKLAIPITLAWYLNAKPLPPSFSVLFVCAIIMLVPVLMTAKQPDLGTALMLACSGACVLFLAGMSYRLILFVIGLCGIGAPVLWYFMHDYQRQRVLTFLDPERDPLGSGYHIIQSKIAVGSGGVFGKGWLKGTQSHLDFLPEHSTDFIFAVMGEEFGLVGSISVITLYLFIIGRCLYISTQAQDTFGRLLVGSLALTFFFAIFINIGMVIGLLPVVGLPLPLISYGGTSMVSIMASFGLIMSVQTHRKWPAR